MVGGGQKMTPFFWVENHESLIVSRKSVFATRLYVVCMEWSGTIADAVYALLSHFCYVGVFRDLGDPVPTLRGVSGDVVTVYANYDTKRHFFAVSSLAQSRSKPGHRHEMTVSTKNRLHESMGWYTTCLCRFSPWTAPKLKFSKLIFLIPLIVQNDHARYVKHFVGRIYLFFTLFGYWVFSWCGGGVANGIGTQRACVIFQPL